MIPSDHLSPLHIITRDKIMIDSIKVQYIDSSDVELTKRGFMEVKIVQEYNNDKSEYTTMFQTNTNNKEEEGENE